MSLNSQIADLILEKGRATAQGQAASGQAWGSALSQIGQSVAAIPKQIEQAKVSADEQRARDARNEFAAALKDVAPLTQEGVSLFNTAGIGERMNAKGFGPEFLPAAQHLDGINAAKLQFRQAQQNVVKQGAAAVAASGNDPAIAGQFLDTLGDVYPAEKVQQFRDFIKADPANVAKLTSYLAGPQKAEILKQGETGFDPLTHQPIPGLAVAAKPTQHVINGQLVDEAGNKLGAAIPEQVKPLTPEDIALKAGKLKEIEARLAGNVPIAAKDKAELQIQRDRLNEEIKHNRSTEAAANPLAAMTGQPAAGGAPAAGAPPAQLTGDDFLKTLPPQVASEVKAYAEGRRPFPGGYALKSPYFQSMIQMVGQYDPAFDAANYNARNKARTDLTSPSGTGGKTINAMNTALQHAGKLSDLIETLDNTEYPLVNGVVNPIKSAIGKTAVTNFNAVAPQLMKEIERAWRGSGGSAGEIQELIKSIGQNQGKQQQREALNNFVELLKGKLDSTQTQRDNVLGTNAGQDIPVLFEKNHPIMERIAQRAAGAKTAAAPKMPTVGDVVAVGGGKRIKVTAMHPDGTFDGDPVP